MLTFCCSIRRLKLVKIFKKTFLLIDWQLSPVPCLTDRLWMKNFIRKRCKDGESEKRANMPSDLLVYK